MDKRKKQIRKCKEGRDRKGKKGNKDRKMDGRKKKGKNDSLRLIDEKI